MNVENIKINTAVYFWPDSSGSNPTAREPARVTVNGISLASNGEWQVSFNHNWSTLSRPLSSLYATADEAKSVRVAELVAAANLRLIAAREIALSSIPANAEVPTLRAAA